MRKLKNEELGRLSPGEFKDAQKTPIIVVLDNVRSLNNIGSVFRTADAFRIEAVYLCGITAKPPHRDIHKTALGATETVHWEYFEKTEEAVVQLKQKGFHIVAVEQADESVALQDFQPADKAVALILGNEVGGVGDAVMEMADTVLEIPQYGTKHSINISVCAGIVVWEVWRKIYYE